MKLLPALSIQQPWASSILYGKDVENRTWFTRYRGEFYIHAGRAWSLHAHYEWAAFVAARGIEVLGALHASIFELPRGGIIGITKLVDCVEQSDSPWFTGPYGFVLGNVRPLPFTPCRGHLGFFRPALP